MFDMIFFTSLKSTYKEDYSEILRELRPREFLRQCQLVEWDKKIKETRNELDRLIQERAKVESELTWKIMKENSK